MARKGLPKSLIKKYGISKKAWRIFRKGKGKKRHSTTRRSSSPKRKVRRMARKKRRGGGKSLQRTVFKLIRIGALLGPAAYDVIRGRSAQEKAVFVLESYTGYNVEKGQFDFRWLARGWTPFLLATLTTYGIPKLTGIIRKL